MSTESLMPMYHARAEYTPTLEGKAGAMQMWRVICANGHAPFSRFFEYASEAHKSAELHDFFVHSVPLNADGSNAVSVADVGTVFVNTP